MAIDSTTGIESRVINAMEELLESREWSVERIPVAGGRDCLLARSRPDPDVTLSTHLDTVPPFIPPRLNGDRLSGRGACDAKGIAASMCVAGERLREAGVAVALLFVVGEERGSDGARVANARDAPRPGVPEAHRGRNRARAPVRQAAAFCRR